MADNEQNDDNEQQSSSNCGPVLVTVFGVAEMLAGYVLGGGPAAPVRIWLIRQGSSDIVFATRTGITQNFSWKEYLLEKMFSLPLSIISFGVEWRLGLDGENMFTGSRLYRVFLKVVMSVARGIFKVFLGKFLNIVKDKILSIYQDKLEAASAVVFEQGFANLQEHVANLFHLNPDKARRLVLDALDDVARRADADGNEPLSVSMENALVELLPTAIGELVILCLKGTKMRDVGDRTMDCMKFGTFALISAGECSVFAEIFLKSLDEALKAVFCQQNQAVGHQELAPPPAADAVNVEEFMKEFGQRVRACVVRKFSEKFRRRLNQAISQSFVPGLSSDVEWYIRSKLECSGVGEFEGSGQEYGNGSPQQDSGAQPPEACQQNNDQ